MKIRKIELNDSENFLNMLKQLDNETEFMLYEPGERRKTVADIESFIKSSENSNSLLLVVEDDGAIVGFLSADRGSLNRIKHSAYIVVGILKTYRSKGLGENLFSVMEKWAKESGITRLELTVIKQNEVGIKLYKKMGFKIEGLKENSILLNGVYVDEYYMGKLL
ncbi:MAG: family N-acetyltransferase [Anaerocolumna sp.]|jgi:RimJ/RimL family protein N-acetyltransferase|nr:family N-acetyltransferase [Anaerocolumna sp.]